MYSSALLALMKNIRVARKTGVILMRFRRRALFARERALATREGRGFLPFLPLHMT